MTINDSTSELTPGQRRTARATATRRAQADAKAAARLRDAGYIVVPERALGPLLEVASQRTGPAELAWERGFRAGVTAVCEVSGNLRD